MRWQCRRERRIRCIGAAMQRRPRLDPAKAKMLVWNAGAPSGHAGGAPAQREDAALIERPHRRRSPHRTRARSASPAFTQRRASRPADERPARRGLLDCASRSAGLDNDPVGVPEQPSGSVLTALSTGSSGCESPGLHPAAGVKRAKARAVRPTSSRPARTATSGGSACSGSPGSRQRRCCRPCRRS